MLLLTLYCLLILDCRSLLGCLWQAIEANRAAVAKFACSRLPLFCTFLSPPFVIQNNQDDIVGSATPRRVGH